VTLTPLSRSKCQRSRSHARRVYIVAASRSASYTLKCKCAA